MQVLFSQEPGDGTAVEGFETDDRLQRETKDQGPGTGLGVGIANRSRTAHILVLRYSESSILRLQALRMAGEELLLVGFEKEFIIASATPIDNCSGCAGWFGRFE